MVGFVVDGSSSMKGPHGVGHVMKSLTLPYRLGLALYLPSPCEVSGYASGIVSLSDIGTVCLEKKIASDL